MSDIAIIHFVNYKRGTQSRAAMRGVMLYVMQEKKTAWEGKPLVNGINCQPQSVYDDFINTKLLYHKDGGVMFYHMVQSFPKGAAVDPQQAHEAARRLAEYFDGCEVLVCTHVDREHIHSHRQGRFRFPDGVRGLRRPLGEWAQVHHLHHAGRHEVPR